MKKILYIAVALIAVWATSCTDDLNQMPNTETTSAQVYKTAANYKAVLGKLCAALGIPFDRAMLSWPKGRRESDGVWAPAWYASVEQSTGFAPPAAAGLPSLPDHLQRIADEALPFYERLAAHRITA